jgi:N-succinyldiaminopimelate aminotransferase
LSSARTRSTRSTKEPRCSRARSQLFLNQTAATNFDLDLESLTKTSGRRTQLLYVCSPGNPTGRVIDLDAWRTSVRLRDRYGFVIASDECYSEIYSD